MTTFMAKTLIKNSPFITKECADYFLNLIDKSIKRVSKNNQNPENFDAILRDIGTNEQGEFDVNLYIDKTSFENGKIDSHETIFLAEITHYDYKYLINRIKPLIEHEDYLKELTPDEAEKRNKLLFKISDYFYHAGFKNFHGLEDSNHFLNKLYDKKWENSERAQRYCWSKLFNSNSNKGIKTAIINHFNDENLTEENFNHIKKYLEETRYEVFDDEDADYIGDLIEQARNRINENNRRIGKNI